MSDMAQAFDELADDYDDDHHDKLARALVELAEPAAGDRIADVACGNGAVALAVAERLPGLAVPIVAVDVSPGMIAAGRVRAEGLGYSAAIDWRVGTALPLPVPDASLDLVFCASALQFMGAGALTDWHRALKPGGRAVFTVPVASLYNPSGRFADLVARDLPLPATPEETQDLIVDAGFTDPHVRRLDRVFLALAVRL
ncbi:class I SAM-dependent methyltransferase [Nonomuraea sp. NPDC050536]|uniref:class I SAM-dependent methyltransferase n=1 Tax=Nonomuraea sp. NPDC050536 TaxID=3364366 RepID=UPI0037C635CE